MLQRIRSISYRPVLKTKHSEGTTVQDSDYFEMMDKSLRVKLIIASLLEHNLSEQISLFSSFNCTRKANIDERFGSITLKPDTSLPNVR